MDPKKVSEALARMRALEEELNDKFIERRRPIRGLILSTLAGECAVFLGPPGTAKTMLVEKFYEQFFGQDNVFYRQFSPHTTPEEIFGPIDYPEYKSSGRWNRAMRGTFSDCQAAVLDEAFKAPSSARNPMLDAIERRRVQVDGKHFDIPLETASICSNEYADSKDDAAFVDRFVMKFWIEDIQDPANFKKFISLTTQRRKAKIVIHSKCDAGDLQIIREAVDAVHDQWSDADTERMGNLRQTLLDAGYSASSRTWDKATWIISASAVLNGRDKIAATDFLVLVDMLWQRHTERADLQAIIGNAVDPYNARAEALLDGIKLAMRDLPEFSQLETGSKRKGEMVTEISKVSAKVSGQRDKLLKELKDAGSHAGLEEALEIADKSLTQVLELTTKVTMYRSV